MDSPLPGHSAQPFKVQPHAPDTKSGGGSLPRASREDADTPSPRLAKVEIYTRRFCADSMRTKGIFDRKNIQYNEYLIDNDVVNSSAMSQRSAGKDTTPQVFIDGSLIGGLAQVMELEHSGDLDFLLGIRA